MMRPKKISLMLSLMSLIFSSLLFSLENDTEKSQQEIIKVLQKWPEDFNAKNIKDVCNLFAPDLIASYPNSLDRNYDDMCLQMTKILNQPEKTFHYDAPKIEQVIVEGNLAIVRLIWTLKVSSKNGSETIEEKGLDVFRRQSDGSWKIAISYAYPLKD